MAFQEVLRNFVPVPVFENEGSSILRQRVQNDGLIKTAKVLYVDEQALSVNVLNLHSGDVIVGISVIAMPNASSSGFSGTLPKIGSFVLIAPIANLGGISSTWAIIGHIASGFQTGQQLLGFETTENEVNRQFQRKVGSHEYLQQAEDGAEVLLNEGVSTLSADITETGYDIFTQTAVENRVNRFHQDLAGYETSGAALRFRSDATGDYPHPTGLSYQYVTPTGVDPAKRYSEGSDPGLVAVERVRSIHELSDLISDFTPHLHGIMHAAPTSLNAISTVSKKQGSFGLRSSDAPPAEQPVVPPKTKDEFRTGQKGPDGKALSPNPTLYEKDAVSPQARSDIWMEHEGSLAGTFLSDKARYGSLLIASLLPEKFSTDVTHDNAPFQDQSPFLKYRLRTPVKSSYSPLPYNQTAHYLTKEGQTLTMLGATLPSTGHPLSRAEKNPKGAGRSAEIVSLGGIEAVISKTQDEEESISATLLGQTFIHFGSDSGVSPFTRRQVKILNRHTGVVETLSLYDYKPILKPGNSDSLTAKTGAESISAFLTLDGALVSRIGVRHPSSKRKFVKNGTSDGPGRNALPPTAAGRKDAHNAAREIYGVGDDVYQFHDLSTATSQISEGGIWSQIAYNDLSSYNPDAHGRSVDLHLCQDMFLRIGKNPVSQVSWSLDTDGAVVAMLGKDMSGRSLYLDLDGGAQIVMRKALNGNAANITIYGNVSEYIEGNVNRVVTGNVQEEIYGKYTQKVVGDSEIWVGSQTTISRTVIKRQATAFPDTQGA